jgi:glutathione S-transferase
MENVMELYFSPLACSMATRIALYEAGAEADFTRVDLKAKLVADGSDFFLVNPMGQVPVLRTEAGETLTENPVVLQYVAERYPNAGLAPWDAGGRYRLQQWLSFIGSELHKLVFSPLLDRASPEGAKEFARAKAAARCGRLERHLAGRNYLLERFSVADAYLTTVLNWCVPAGVDLLPYPAVQDYHRRMLARPSVAKAVAEERALYAAEQAKAA